MARPLFAATVFSGAFLLFLVQPLISRQLLPWFGGSAAVWATCLVFFQVVLLAGYAYSDWIARHLRPRHQAGVHLALLAISLINLSVIADPSWKPKGGEDPSLWILYLLVATIGLPYFLLSTTGPLVQSWVARTLTGSQVYRFFALSNLASLIALICYPFLIEPHASIALQARAWTALYLFFVLACAASALFFMRHALPAAAHAKKEESDKDVKPGLRSHVLWLALSAMGTWLLLATTNHITQNIAAVPFLWLLPLTIYLLTFILCFESDRWYARSRLLLPTALMLVVCAYGLQHRHLGFEIRIAVPLYAAGLFLFCMFLHGELAGMRPAPRHLTRFYLMVSLGGALGGIAVGLVAPRILPAYYELGIGFVILALLAACLFPGRLLPVGAGVLAVLCAYFLSVQVSNDSRQARRMERSFYGSLRTVDTRHANPEKDVRELFNGSIRHGEQYLDPKRRSEPTTYYGRTSGIGLAIACTRTQGRKLGVIGLGAGTLAAYGRAGDVYRFYEINPQVIDIARSEFSFLRDSRARVDIVQGDARLALESEAPQRFDVLAIDAFSGDSIPIHLITREAMDVYLRHLASQGILAFHVTNRFLELAPVVANLAKERGLHAVLIEDEGEGTTSHSTDWVLVARDKNVLEQGPIADAASPIEPIEGLGIWTDDFNNLFDVLK
ncbi:fused MFS/spermidine synthase [Noviherbaspirillum massiliense]|uniref:fused MFS/spermidine synthase n=1 Tax=Noviherbaspirillum massiliense TaxID=1465823 RepID=UPI0002ED447C|nr:fused MFS/spermidine synthase [Noviherbaspirillum massiliense]